MPGRRHQQHQQRQHRKYHHQPMAAGQETDLPVLRRRDPRSPEASVRQHSSRGSGTSAGGTGLSRFVEGSMNDRTSVIPPSSFLGDDEPPLHLRRQPYLGPVPHQLAQQQQDPQEQRQPPRPNSSADPLPPQLRFQQAQHWQAAQLHHHSHHPHPLPRHQPTTKKSGFFLGQVWDGVREKLGLTRSRSSGTITSGDDADFANQPQQQPQQQQRAGNVAGLDALHLPQQKQPHVYRPQSSHKATKSFPSFMMGPPSGPHDLASVAAATAFSPVPAAGGAGYPNKEEVLASYKSLMASGFFDAHAIHTTRPSLGAGLPTTPRVAKSTPNFATESGTNGGSVSPFPNVPKAALTTPGGTTSSLLSTSASKKAAAAGPAYSPLASAAAGAPPTLPPSMEVVLAKDGSSIAPDEGRKSFSEHMEERRLSGTHGDRAPSVTVHAAILPTAGDVSGSPSRGTKRPLIPDVYLVDPEDGHRECDDDTTRDRQRGYQNEKNDDEQGSVGGLRKHHHLMKKLRKTATRVPSSEASLPDGNVPVTTVGAAAPATAAGGRRLLRHSSLIISQARKTPSSSSSSSLTPKSAEFRTSSSAVVRSPGPVAAGPSPSTSPSLWGHEVSRSSRQHQQHRQHELAVPASATGVNMAGASPTKLSKKRDRLGLRRRQQEQKQKQKQQSPAKAVVRGSGKDGDGDGDCDGDVTMHDAVPSQQPAAWAASASAVVPTCPPASPPPAPGPSVRAVVVPSFHYPQRLRRVPTMGAYQREGQQRQEHDQELRPPQQSKQQQQQKLQKPLSPIQNASRGSHGMGLVSSPPAVSTSSFVFSFGEDGEGEERSGGGSGGKTKNGRRGPRAHEQQQLQLRLQRRFFLGNNGEGKENYGGSSKMAAAGAAAAAGGEDDSPNVVVINRDSGLGDDMENEKTW